ncbi:tyrosine-type recombinase/integrase [Methylorubrum populi]
MSVYRPKNSSIYLYDFQRGGIRFHGSTGATEEREAKRLEKAEIKKAEALTAANRKKKNAPMTVGTAAARYYAEVGQHTAKAHELLGNLDRIVEWIGNDTPIADVTDEMVSRLVARRRGDQRRNAARDQAKRGRKHPALGLVSPAQVNRSFTQILRRILTRARKVWKQMLPEEPNWSAHMLAEPKERVRELRHEEEGRLESVERADYQAPRIFAQITGLRRREVANLTWPQVDFHASVIRVVGKGDKPHTLPITPELQALLWPLRGHHPTSVFTYVCQRTRTCPRSKRRFIRGERYPITYEGLSTQLGRSIVKAGIEDFRLHDLRHTAASRFQRANKDLRLTQTLLNHSSPKMTVRYAHVNEDDMREALIQASLDNTSRREKSRRKSRSQA